MKKALVKKIITMILLLTLIVPACFIRLDAVYGDNKQNLNDANNKKIYKLYFNYVKISKYTFDINNYKVYHSILIYFKTITKEVT